MSPSFSLPAGPNNTFHMWLWATMGGSGSGEVGTNARRLFSFLQIWENIIFWTVDVIKHYTHALHDL